MLLSSFRDEDTESQKGWVAYPGSPSKVVQLAGLCYLPPGFMCAANPRGESMEWVMLGSQHRSYKWQVRRQRGAFLAEEVWPVQGPKGEKQRLDLLGVKRKVGRCRRRCRRWQWRCIMDHCACLSYQSLRHLVKCRVSCKRETGCVASPGASGKAS